MNPTAAFLTDVGFVAILSIGLVAYLKPHLHALLVELCGTAERASFWLAFSNVTLVLVPLIFALNYEPEFGPNRNFIFEMATQLKYAIIGFVIALSFLAIILFASFRGTSPWHLVRPAERKVGPRESEDLWHFIFPICGAGKGESAARPMLPWELSASRLSTILTG